MHARRQETTIASSILLPVCHCHARYTLFGDLPAGKNTQLSSQNIPSYSRFQGPKGYVLIFNTMLVHLSPSLPPTPPTTFPSLNFWHGTLTFKAAAAEWPTVSAFVWKPLAVHGLRHQLPLQLPQALSSTIRPQHQPIQHRAVPPRAVASITR